MESWARSFCVACAAFVLAWSATVLAADTDLEEKVSHIERLNVTAPWPESQSLIDEIQPLLDEATPDQQARVALVEARNLALSGNDHEAIGLIDRLSAMEMDPALSLRAYSLAANIAVNQDDYEPSFAYLRKGLELLDQVDTPALRADIQGLASFLYALIGVHEKAEENSIRAVRDARASGDPRELCASLQRRAFVQSKSDTPVATENTLRRAIQACQEAADPIFEAVVQQMLGSNLLEQGLSEQAIDWLQTGLDNARDSGFKSGELQGRMGYAEGLFALGEVDQALSLLEGLPGELESLGDWEAKTRAHRLKAEIAEHQGNDAEALRQIKAAWTADQRRLNQEQLMRTAYTQVEFETYQTEQELALLEERDQMNTVVRNGAIGGSLLMLVLAAVIYNRYRLKVRATRVIEKKNRELATLDEIVAAINSQESFDAVLTILLEQTIAFFETADSGVVMIRDVYSKGFQVISASGKNQHDGAPEHISAEQASELYARSGREIATGIHLHDRWPEVLEGCRFVAAAREAVSIVTISISIDRSIEGLLVLSTSAADMPFSSEDAGRFSRIRAHATSALSRALSLEHMKDENERAEEAILRLRMTQQNLEQTAIEANRANKAKTEFLHRVSHELRTPLHAVIGYSEKLRRTLDSDTFGDASADVGYIHTSGHHLLSVINDILDMSRIEAGEIEINRETADVCQLSDQVAGIVRPLVEKNGNRLEVHCDASVGAIETDAVKLKQILFNLLSNAAKFTDNGVIRLHVSLDTRSGDQSARNLRVQVSDTGIGMSASQLNRVFDPFVQASADVGRKYGGTGLGLTISRRLCRLLGGEIRAESTPGAGSVFTMVLPCTVDTPALSDDTRPDEAGRLPSVAADRKAPDASRVLVIEDNRINLRLMTDFLEMEGYQVLSARDGQEGINLVREQLPDIVLMDMSLPNMTGLEATEALKADARTQHIPIIGVSAYATDDAEAKAFAAGCDAYETKPVDFARLVKTIRRLWGGMPAVTPGGKKELLE